MQKFKLIVAILLISTSISAQTGMPDYTWYSGEESQYSISSTDQLLALSNIVNGTAGEEINNGFADNFSNKIIFLTTDLDLSNYNYPGGAFGWTSIGNTSTKPFRGNFDGQNYTIKNLVSYYSDDTLVGLFGYVRNGKIGQLNMEGVDIQIGTTQQTNHAAGIVAYLEAAQDSAIVENCSATGIITASRYGDNGGLIGCINSYGFAIVRNCTSNVNLLNGNKSGLIGHIITNRSVAVRNCVNNGALSCVNNQGSYGGGLIGHITNYYLNQCTISNCSNTGEVANFGSGGGIIGSVNGGPLTIDHCSNTAKVYNGYYIGGIIGFSWGSCTINTSYNSGRILSSTYGGGLIGYIKSRCSITNSYNTGDVLVSGETGGTGGGITGFIAATWYDTTSIKNCYNTGSVVGDIWGDAGGIAGYGYANNYGFINIRNCVTIGCSLSGYITGCGRTMGGFEGDISLKNNFGWHLTKVNGDTVSNNNLNGTGIHTFQVATAANWWNGTTGYFSAADNSMVKPDQLWVFNDNQLPLLKLMPGQSATWAVCSITYTIIYITNGGSVIEENEVSMFGKALRPANPTRPGYTFVDWYSDPSLNSVFDFNTLITKNIILYAKWEPIPMVLNPEKISASYSCTGDNTILSFGVKTGLPAEYKIVFGTKETTAGFVDVEYTPILTTDSTIKIPVPLSAPAGSYTATLFIRGIAGNESSGDVFNITKLLSADVIVGKFTNLVLCDNSLNYIQKYQWYRNGIQVANADKQYYDDEAGRGGNSYQVQVVTSAGDTLMSCPKTFMKSQMTSVNLKSFPNPLAPGEMCTLEVEGLAANDLEASILTIYNSFGTIVYRSERVTELNKIIVPGIEGIYVCEIVTTSGASYSCKILLSR